MASASRRIIAVTVAILISFFLVPPCGADTFDSIISNVQLRTLPNGLRVIFYRRPIAPVFSGFVGVRVGGTDEPSGQTGIAHILEHMAFKGTPEIGANDHAKEKKLLDELEEIEARADAEGKLSTEQQQRFDEIQAQLKGVWITNQFTREYEVRGGAGMNATTDSELTRYFVNMPRSAFEFWAFMESERLRRPVMRQFYQERAVVLEERRMRVEDSPEGKLYELILSTVFRAHPYRNPVIGYLFDVSRLTARQVEEFRRRFYVPGNIVVSIVGDVEADRDLPVIEKYFGRLPSGPMPNRPAAVEPPQQGERRTVLEDKASPQIAVAYRKPQWPHPDDPPISVMLSMLADGKSSPLYSELVTRRRIVVGYSQEEFPGIAYPNAFMFWFNPRAPHRANEVLAGFEEVIERFKKEGGTQAQLERAKRRLKVEYLAGFDSNMSLAAQLAAAELVFNDWRAPFEWFDRASEVTLEDVKRVANQYLNDSSSTIAELKTVK